MSWTFLKFWLKWRVDLDESVFSSRLLYVSFCSDICFTLLLLPVCKKQDLRHGLIGKWTRRQASITRTQIIDQNGHVLKEVVLTELNGLVTDQRRMDFVTHNRTSGLGNPHGMMGIAGIVGVTRKRSLDTVMILVDWKERATTGKLLLSSVRCVFVDVDALLVPCFELRYNPRYSLLLVVFQMC